MRKVYRGIAVQKVISIWNIYIRDYFRSVKNSFAEKLLGFKYR